MFGCKGSIWPPVLAHVFCNMMGFPNPGYAMQQFPDERGRELHVASGVMSPDGLCRDHVNLCRWNCRICSGFAQIVDTGMDDRQKRHSIDNGYDTTQSVINDSMIA